ncbi:lipid A biosynthesis lauroyl acyltransferase [Enterovirga aerilata]|uniref:Lipid A biosynthesis lauroyl acyltransferase n=1 Tax=Enterovirga aerilata TaxID=2730920 RepID=A0A849I5Z6_9HYPH|nr:lipid A biosynthesis lauroyl acyltransferase [Enterovirga sp. DB1703]NNM73114.1 lipid A biosynthesis lauroyl acyltransferase [Enterovirga sp. DB1703]
MAPLTTVLRAAKARFLGAVVAGAVRSLFAFARLIGPDRSSDLGAWLVRTVGPLLPQHRIALANLRAVYPEKSEAERRAIARSAWANLGRTGAEYAHLDRLFDYDPEASTPGRVDVVGIEHFLKLRDDGLPGIVFSAHLGNWELPAICAARFGLDATAVFRPPNDPAAARLVYEVRSGTMGGLTASSGGGAAFAIAAVLERGGHLGQLIDQHFTRGVVTSFMGRPALTNPLLAKLARHHDCPVHGVRVIRLQGHRFRIELTPPLDLPRDAEGRIDVAGATQAMTAVVERWVRETPEQWLWMHRRWRVPASTPAQAAASQQHHPVR